MDYVSFSYYIFVAAVAAAYYIIPLKYRWTALLAGSLGFYWYITRNSRISFFVLLVMAFLCWLLSGRMKQGGKNKKLLLIISVLSLAVPLLVLKEAGFFADVIVHRKLPTWWLVPVGFSFYILQLIAYSVDVYKGKVEPESNFWKFLLFVSFFPQIIQGPIPRFKQLAGQLTTGHAFDEKKFVKGFMLILWGFFLKFCIADKAAVIVDTVFNEYPTYTGAYVLLGGVLYSFQLYADFLSCTTLAQGVSGLFGIELIDNFGHPYFAVSIKDFWRRWHISLSSWLRDYVYIPLGGNRKGRARKYLNLLLTFAVSGIWHGAGFKFLFWGLLHGFYQVIGELLSPVRKRLRGDSSPDGKQDAFRIVDTCITFFLVMIAWIIFRAERLKTGLSMILSIFTVHNYWIFTNDSVYSLGLGWKECKILTISLLILLAVSFMQEKGVKIRDRILDYNPVIRWTIYISAILFVMIFGTYGWGFDSQAFIYGGF